MTNETESIFQGQPWSSHVKQRLELEAGTGLRSKVYLLEKFRAVRGGDKRRSRQRSRGR
jgi:hypothetical protein